MAQRDEQGLYVPGYRVAPDCGESFSDQKIRSCPVAGANKMASIISAYHRHHEGLFKLCQSYPRPSWSIIDAVDVLHSKRSEAQYRAQERAMKEAQHG